MDLLYFYEDGFKIHGCDAFHVDLAPQIKSGEILNHPFPYISNLFITYAKNPKSLEEKLKLEQECLKSLINDQSLSIPAHLKSKNDNHAFTFDSMEYNTKDDFNYFITIRKVFEITE